MNLWAIRSEGLIHQHWPLLTFSPGKGCWMVERRVCSRRWGLIEICGGQLLGVWRGRGSGYPEQSVSQGLNPKA